MSTEDHSFTIETGGRSYRLTARPWPHAEGKRWIPKLTALLARTLRASGVRLEDLEGAAGAGDVPEELDLLAMIESVMSDEDLFVAFVDACEKHTDIVALGDTPERIPFEELAPRLAGQAALVPKLVAAHLRVQWSPFFSTSLSELAPRSPGPTTRSG